MVGCLTLKVAIFLVMINDSHWCQVNEEDCGLCMFSDLWDNLKDFSVSNRSTLNGDLQ